ncbi:hypothetical protein F0562_021874 [Nyssa sinensis]|uniref:Protein yippee-like n=1 Tax=Nyssa sinensis TaxID=561372 RepID=A0A5J5BM58_9ASTE|nr:hypothetical protein F0562_021874 [Nyssa sinensis]
MGRLFLIQFDQTPDAFLYLCAICETHIASWKEYAFAYHGLPNDTIGAIFHKIVNVYGDGPEQHHKFGDYTVEDVHCNKCGNLLGFKFIDNANDNQFRVGDFCLPLKKLLIWDGEDGGEMMDADTGDPV